MLGEAPIGPPPKSPVGRLIGAASVHLPRAGAVSFDERYYPVPNPRHLSRFSRRWIPSVVNRPVFATIREKFRTPKTRQFDPLLGEEGALIQKLPERGKLARS